VDVIRLGTDDLKPTTTIEGKILDFLPHKLPYSRISFNFGEWKNIEMVSNEDFANSDILNTKYFKLFS
jgi:hypothetical protein